MNVSLQDLKLPALVISQFILYGNCRNSRRPDFIQAAVPEKAEPLYKQFIALLEKKLSVPVAQGQFGAKMEVHLINDGPVTFVIDT